MNRLKQIYSNMYVTIHTTHAHTHIYIFSKIKRLKFYQGAKSGSVGKTATGFCLGVNRGKCAKKRFQQFEPGRSLSRTWQTQH